MVCVASKKMIHGFCDGQGGDGKGALGWKKKGAGEGCIRGSSEYGVGLDEPWRA